MDKQEFMASLRQVFDTDPGQLSGNELLSEIGWDSLAVVQFQALADDKYKVVVDPAEIRNCNSVNDVYNALTNACNRG